MKTILFDFSAKRDSALAQVSKMFGKAGAQVIDTSVDANPSARAGVKFRNVDLTFADGQRVTLAVKETGDIFAVKINGAAVPLKEQDDAVGAIAEIATQLERRRSAFQRALARTKVSLPPTARTSRSDMLKAKTAQRDALAEAVSEAEKELAALTA